MLRPLLLGLAAAGVLSACASSHSAPAPAPTGPAAIAAGAAAKAAPRSTRDILIGDDLVATGGGSVYDAITRMRPIFFTARSTSGGPRVMIDDAARSMDDLRILPPAQIDFVRYYDIDDAQGRFGVSSPVIYVVSRGHQPRFPLPKR